MNFSDQSDNDTRDDLIIIYVQYTRIGSGCLQAKTTRLSRNLVANLTGSGNPQLKRFPEVNLMAVGDYKLLTTPHDSFQHMSTRLNEN